MSKTRIWRDAFGLLVAGAVVVGCSEAKKSAATTCADDDGCPRGQTCDVEARSCISQNCEGPRDCISGQACLADTHTCSKAECGTTDSHGQVLTCASGRTCITEGPNRLTCTGDVACQTSADCAVVAEGWHCCASVCRASCASTDGGGDLATITPVDAGGTPVPADAGPGGTGGTGGTPPPADTGVPPVNADICTPCTGDADCAALGEGAACKTIVGGSYCTKSCEAAADCEAPFVCKDNVKLCLPPQIRCGCFADGCAAGEICDPGSSACMAPKDECSACLSDAECAAGMKCGALGAGHYCLAKCGDGCPAGTQCEDDVCKPESGVCDACGGACAAPTPLCIPGANGAPGVCGECAVGTPCPNADERCGNDHMCTAGPVGGDCVTDADCLAPLPYCVAGACVECFSSDQCGARHSCEAQTCIDDPCGGLVCPNGAGCDAATGRCIGGCENDEDCGDPAAMFCDMSTGMCFNRDGSCDGITSFCAPGSVCQPMIPGMPPEMGIPGNCTCVISNPQDPALSFCNPGDVVACPPGLYCSYFSLDPANPPANGTCGQDMFGLCGGP